MKLNRREFLRATGLTGLLATFGIELPGIEAAEELPVITEAVVLPDCGIGVSVQAPRLPLVDLTGLGGVSIEFYRPPDLYYIGGFDAPFFARGPQHWEISVMTWESRLNEIGLSPDDLFSLGGEARFRFSLKGRRFEGDGILDYLRHNTGPFADGGGSIEMSIGGTSPLWVSASL